MAFNNLDQGWLLEEEVYKDYGPPKTFYTLLKYI